ncbi:MAG: phage portal protein [Gemmatimonadota bacterium]|nr:phage portal protein [Gemmatimonadota bacterium]
MRWPWEKRQSYSSIVSSALLEAAQGKVIDAAQTAALESAAGVWAGAFAAARVEPEDTVLSPAWWSEAVRDLIRYGEAVYRIRVQDGEPDLQRASAWTINGGIDPETWIYDVEHAGPANTERHRVPAAGVVHMRYSSDAARPWSGVGPMGRAAATGRLAGALERGLADEAGGAVSRIIPIPADGDEARLDELRADLAKGEGRGLLLRTTAAGWGEGPGAAPRSDWRQQRIGPEPPAELAELRRDTFAQVLAACAVPLSLVSDADGTSQREAWRRFVMGQAEPLGRVLVEEIVDKLEMTVRLDFGGLWAHDLAGRAQAFQRLVAGGMEIQQAAAVSGVLTE